MKLNKILSSALVVVLLFAALIGVIPPITADAAYVPDDTAPQLTSEQVKKIVNDAMKYDFDSAEEMLNYELENKYLISTTSESGEYTIFVNRYTGVLYYRNNLTGQILTSNPYSYQGDSTKRVDDETRKNLLSQINLQFKEITSGSEKNIPYNSTTWAALYGQISTEFIADGIRVNYVLGDTSTRFLLPGRIKADKYEEMILLPLLDKFREKLEEYCGEQYPDTNFSFLDNPNYVSRTVNGYVNANTVTTYVKDMTKIFKTIYKNAKYYQYTELTELASDITGFRNKYFLNDPAAVKGPTRDTMIKDYYTAAGDVDPNLEIFTTLEPIYVFDEGAGIEDKRSYSAKFRKYAGDYSFSDMYADELECGYVDNSGQKPVFRCALEYTFNIDGTLSVRLPANSITFDEAKYTLVSIAPISYFGAGDAMRDGYIFFPDGSGTVIEYGDFYGKVNVNVSERLYGDDYAYSKITGKRHEQVTMPVYGIVSEVGTNETTKNLTDKATVTNGFFAIIEEGAALATLNYKVGTTNGHPYAYAYTSYTPYPMDIYDLSDQISVGASEEYTMVANTKYNGSYVTKIVMLSDEEVGATISAISGGRCNYSPASYVGMANYYREYLKDKGVLESLGSVTDNLPLYIEALGSIEIVDKVLSFPVTKKLPLTRFEDVYTIYEELANCKDKFLEKATEYEEMADEAEDEALAASYKATAKSYREMAKELVDIENVNFKLTGFGNGGMAYTYPTKVRWDKACGGAAGLASLMQKADEISESLNAKLGIFPDYDFMYVNNYEAFDGISTRGNISKMVDNRYASKQTYNSIIGMYESFFTLVVNPGALENLYSKFISQYSKYDLSGVSVSTLGSDLNSNFDEDETVDRHEAMQHVSDVLQSIKYQHEYEIMTDVGNDYVYKYVDHILDACIDSSHTRFSSYTVPFVGMVLHSYVNYTGSAINYAGNAEYDVLRAIESGASLYYILCYQNSAYLKDDPNLSKYYGVDYTTWYDSIVTTYAKLNSQIGDLQKYEIIDHRVIIGERVIDEKEENQNLKLLMDEMLVELGSEIQAALNEANETLLSQNAEVGTPIKLIVDKDAIKAQFNDLLGISDESEINEALEAMLVKFYADIDVIVAEFEDKYAIPEENTKTPYEIEVSSVEYTSQYSFITDSLATDKDYVRTDFTSDVDNIVIVTYSNGVDTVKFVLNYNIYSVTVNLGDEGVWEIGKYSYQRIEEGGNA